VYSRQILRMLWPYPNTVIFKGLNMFTIRYYNDRDAQSVGKLIAETYSKDNLWFVPTAELGLSCV
jgi:hypothetical protein